MDAADGLTIEPITRTGGDGIERSFADLYAAHRDSVPRLGGRMIRRRAR